MENNEPKGKTNLEGVKGQALKPAPGTRTTRARDALLDQSSNLAKPTSFDPTKQYRIRLKKAVPVHEGAPDVHMLRPSADVVVSGAFAQDHIDDISGAEEV